MERQDTPRAWKLESSETLAEYDIFSLRRDRARSPRMGTLHDFHVVDAPDGVTVIALTDADELVMVEQFRQGTRRLSLETPSGLMDDGEEPTAAGRRELREETGYEGDAARCLGTVAVNPSWETARAHVILLTGARPAGETEQDPGEDTHLRLVARAELPRLVREGEIDSAVVLAALHLLQLAQPDGSGGADDR